MKTRKIDPITQGFLDSQKLLNQWNSQPNPPKVYVLGHRVHHGLIGALVGLIGLDKGDAYLVGAGLAAVIDDIDDAEKWLDFEAGGDPNSIIDAA